MKVLKYGWHHAMDDLDRTIVTAQQQSNRYYFAEIAELVGSSAASWVLRVNKLRSAGVSLRHLASGSEGAWQIAHAGP
nr:AsnC family transcriptional regulator [Mesorhizobium silamurunense]